MANNYDPDEIATAIGDSRMAAASQAAGSVDENPDDAARAIQLGQATGIHPLAIVGDDTFEPRHKAQLAAQIINNNDALQRYVNSHPLAARVSNDDWGGLDQASRSIGRVGDRSILGRFIEEFKEGFGDPQLGQWMYQHEPTAKFLEKYPALALWVAGVGGAVELPAKLFTGTLHGAHGAIEQGLIDAGMESSSAKKLAKDLTGFLEYKYMRPEAGAKGPIEARRIYKPLKAEIEKLTQENEAARPWLEAKEEPPYGIAKDVDSIKEDQLALDEKALDAAVKDFQSTATFTRSPEMASIFAGVHPETKLEVSADAIRRIYGENEPTSEDGLFGGIPGFIEQFHSAEEIGGGVEISLNDWLRLDKEVIKELKEDVRHREGGVSRKEVEEAKEAPKVEEEGIDVWHGSPHEFEAFDLGKIGTGEGAQAYGHGLYLAEAEAVGRNYLRVEGPNYLKKAASDPILGPKLDKLEKEWIKAEAEYQEANRQGDSAKISDAAVKANNAAEAFTRIQEQAAKQYPVESSLYKVRIRAKKEHFLDWDKPLSEQPAAVQKMVRENADTSSVLPGDLRVMDALQKDPKWKGRWDEDRAWRYIRDLFPNISEGAMQQIADRVEQHVKLGTIPETFSGERIHHALVERHGPERTAQIMREAGIPGIKYLDQQSRNIREEKQIQDTIKAYENQIEGLKSGALKAPEGSLVEEVETFNREKHIERLEEKIEELKAEIGKPQTYNYVVFDPSILTILSRNGQALASVEKAAGLESKVMKAARAEPPKPPSGEPPKPPEGEPPEPSPLTQPIFGKGALSLPQTQVDRIQKLIDQKNRENMERELKRAAKAEARKQTAEWKDNRKSMQAEVETEFYQKPEVAATQWLFDNKLGKAKTGKYTLDETKVTPEQRASLPDRLFAKSGRKLSPDELAQQVGAATGKELLDDLASLHEAIGETPWRQAFREAISAETDRRMTERYGDLAKNILEEAKDHALGITTMDLLHEDTVAMGMLAGAEMPYTKGEVRGWIKAFSRDQLMSTLRADKFLQNSGRLGKLIEIALASQKFSDAFKTAQSREYNALMAREAKRIEKERSWFENQAKRWRRVIKPEDPISGEAGDMIHALLIKTGNPINRSIQQIQDSMTGHGWDSLRDFVEAKQGEGEVAQFPSWIYDADPKAVKDMTYDEFKQVSDGLKGLLAYGKRAKKIFVGDREINRIDARDEMIAAQAGFPTKSYREAAPKGWQKMKQKLKELALLPIQPEFFVDRLDLGDKWGPHTQYMIRDVIDSGNNTWTKWRKYGKMFDKIGDKETDWHELIPNSLLRNPDTGETLRITRSELRTIILNMGNPSNFKKLVEGWKVDPLALKAWVKDHSIQADWDWAAGVGKIFEQSGRESQRMWRRLYGAAWDFVDLPPVQTPFGERSGWYVPLIKDAYFEKEFNSANKIYANKPTLFEYVHDRVATPDGHTKERTQSVYPLSLDVRMIPGRLRTMIYDTEMREAVLNFRSFSQDSEWRTSVRSKFGKHYTDMLDAYIKDVANWPIDNAEMISGVNSITASLLRNIVTSLIAFNIGTPLKHGPTALALSARTVGSKDFASAFRSVWLSSASPQIRKIIWEKSEEIQRRTRNYEESLFGSYIESTIGESKGIKVQRKYQQYGAGAVAFSDRLSSEPTWWGDYNKALNEGRSEGDAVYAANRAVRFAHGSTAITSRPAAMRGGPMSKMFTILYGFFNDMFNRSYKMAWQAKDTVTDAHDLFKAGEAKEGWTTASKGGRRFLGDLVVLGLFVGMVEEIVAGGGGGKDKEEEGLGTIVTKGVIHGLASQVPILREVVYGALHGHPPEAGALGAAYRAGYDLYRDFTKVGERDLDDHLLHLGDYAQHLTTALGVATGIGSRPAGNAMKYWYNVGQGIEEPPEGPWGAIVGTRFGTTKRHSKTLDEYTSHWLEKAGMK